MTRLLKKDENFRFDLLESVDDDDAAAVVVAVLFDWRKTFHANNIIQCRKYN